jgi:hypothetical protein
MTDDMKWKAGRITEIVESEEVEGGIACRHSRDSGYDEKRGRR